jgi:hypothetical protein
MGLRGPKPVCREELFGRASVYYWDLRRLREGYDVRDIDPKLYKRIKRNVPRDHPGRFAIAREGASFSKHRPGAPEVFKNLLRSATPAEVRAICSGGYRTQVFDLIHPGTHQLERREMKVHVWPLEFESTLPKDISDHAEEWIAALRDRRYPRSSRGTSELKQVWFLSRALAGAVLGLSTRTAVNLWGSLRPEEILQDANAGKPPRKKKRGSNGSRKR